ncbi:hypothetical protein GGR53DRAFT_462600 [Hypoxylon sp. FL1150]|nr:hypothetical protein GGR53DRAFT_462600 [Hypoxylon sp. FL1150]
MGRGEASQPPRHSSHHLRHSQSHGQRNSHEIIDDRPRLKHRRTRHENDISPVDLERPSQAQTRHDVVKNWLTHDARQRPHTEPSRLQGHRGEVGDNGRSQPHDATYPYNKHSRRADPGWRPRHIFPRDSIHQSGPPQELGSGDARKSARKWAVRSDSSFISGFENSTMPLKHDPESLRREHGNIPPVGPLREAGLEHLDASSSTSHINDPVNFEKRPRRKTREDKYETEKKKRHREGDNDANHSGHQKKKHKKSEKKTMASSKNVVNNFTSGAVLNDRITVQPHLKPGLFDNGRTSKKQPVPDLAFSEMQFLKHQKKGNQPKALSRSRLREKRREDREMEQVSTFFLPPRADGNNHKLRHQHQGSGIHNDRIDFQRLNRQFGSEHSQEFSKSPTSDPRIRPRPYQTLRDEDSGTPSVDFHEYTGDNQASDKNTTYFTWSSSRYSPRGNAREDRTSPSISDSAWTSTPEPIRRKLIATGVYRYTGIPAYDDRLPEPGTRTITETTLPGGHRYLHHNFDSPQKFRYRDQAVMTDDPLNQSDRPRRNSSTPQTPQRRHENGVESAPLGNPMKEDSRRPTVQEGSISPASHGARQVDRQRIAKGVRLALIEKGHIEQGTQTPSMGTQTSFTHQSPKLVDAQANPNQEKQTQETSDRASIASRDAMPPPPIPYSANPTASMAYANTEDANRPGQSSSLSNTATTMPQSLPARGLGSATPDTHEPTPSCNPTAPSFSPSTNIERILPSFDTLTWLPQRVPSARIIENRNIPSRPSIKSPISVNQLGGIVSEGSYRQDSVLKSHVPESIAEFIARIEGESQLQSQAQDYDLQESELDQDDTVLTAHPFDVELPHGQPSAYYTDEQARSKPPNNLNFPCSNLGEAGIEHQAGDFYAEAQTPQYEVGSPRVFGTVAQPAEDFEENSEMMSFWRPNQFSWF